MSRTKRLEQLKSGVKLTVTRSDFMRERGIEHWSAGLETKDQLLNAQASSPELAVYKLGHEIAQWIIGHD